MLLLEDLEKILTLYKELGNKIIEKLNSAYYEDLKGLFAQRNECIQQLKQHEFHKEDLQAAYRKHNIQVIDEQIKSLIADKKNKVLNSYKNLNSYNKMSAKYKSDAAYNKFNIFNVKL